MSVIMRISSADDGQRIMLSITKRKTDKRYDQLDAMAVGCRIGGRAKVRANYASRV